MKYLQLRFADEALHARVKDAAKDARRSMNAQILWMLEQQLGEPQRHTVHYHWPVLCGFASVPEGDTWSGNLGDVTCPACLVRAEPGIGMRDEAGEFGFGRNAAPPWEQPTS